MRNIQFNINIRMALHNLDLKTELREETSYILFMRVSAGLNKPIAEQIETSTYEPNRRITFNTNKI
jgi:hypothetical protein